MNTENTVRQLPPLPDIGQQINRLVSAAFRKGQLWERCQGKALPEAESGEFTKLRDETVPDAIAQLQRALASAPTAPQAASANRPSADWYKAKIMETLDDDFHVGPAPQSWPLPGWEVQQAKPQPLSDEQDRALCEAYCNTASDEYFSARPHLDSAENRRIFYAGHRKAWIEWQAAHGIDNAMQKG